MAPLLTARRPSQVNLRGLHPLLRAEIKWGMFAYTQKAHGRWELVTWQGLALRPRAWTPVADRH